MAVAFEEAAAKQAAEVSQAASELVGHEEAPDDDAILGNKDA